MDDFGINGCVGTPTHDGGYLECCVCHKVTTRMEARLRVFRSGRCAFCDGKLKERGNFKMTREHAEAGL